MKRLYNKLAALFNRSRRNQNLQDELNAHIAMDVQARIEGGEPPDDAYFSARRDLGNLMRVQEDTRATWGWTSLQRFAQNVHYVVRQMKRTPGFTAGAVLTLALGLGATTAMFSIVNGVLLKPMPYHDPDRLYFLRTVVPSLSKVSPHVPVNARHFYDWRSSCQSCEQVALANGMGFTFTEAGEPERLPGLIVSSNFFRTLGVQPALGRDFASEEEFAGRFRVVILADSLWRNRFGSDASIIGRTLVLNGEPHVVIGVMPPTLHLPRGEQWGTLFPHNLESVMFRPIDFGNVAQIEPAGNFNYHSIVRLKPGIEPASATAELDAAIAGYARQFNTEMRTTLIPLQEQVTGGVRSALWLLLAAVGSVLLIVCVNIGNLMLVRSTSRHREAGMRLALGASRSQLFGLFLTEAIILIGLGGALGLLVAQLALKVFAGFAPLDLPRLDEVSLDWSSLAFAAAAAGLSTLISGLFPAWRLARTDPQTSLRGGFKSTEGVAGMRIRETIVGVEVALTTVLLIVGNLLVLSFIRLANAEKGFRMEHVITQGVSLTSPRYNYRASRDRFIDDVLNQLSKTPGVIAASVTNQIPLISESWIDDLKEADKIAPNTTLPQANFRFVGPDYLKTMQIPLVTGRFFEERDRQRQVAVISQGAARQLWPNQDPIGRHIYSGVSNTPPEVIGVVGDVREGWLAKAPPLVVYQPYWIAGLGGPSFVVRSNLEPADVIAQMRTIIHTVDPQIPIVQTRTMKQVLDEAVAVRRFQMYLAVAFAAYALLLASVGIYGVLSFAVARRTPEMGIRIALGARGGQLITMMLRRGLLPVIVGLAAGLTVALSIGGLLSSELYSIAPHDPFAIFTVVLLLLFVAGLACYVPASRAARIDPMHALRFE